jgi:diaminopimelate decarboxylase
MHATHDLIAWAAAERVPTPALLVSPAAVRAGVARLRRGLGGRISYATKANPHPRVMGQLRDLVDEFNVTNLPHLDDVLALGVEPSRITFLHPVATAGTLAAVAARGVTRFVVDDARGLRLLRDLHRPLRVTLRLLPPDAGESTRSVIRFGGAPDEVRVLAREALDAGLELEAVSFFVGTASEGMAGALPHRRGIELLARIAEQLVQDGIRVPAINIGGGFPGSGRRFHLEHPDFFPAIARSIRDHFGAGFDFVSEPGRYLAEPSMAMLTRVIADREQAGRRLVHVDASAYGGLFEHCFIEHGGADLTIEPTADEGRAAAVVGPVMDSFDVIKRRAELPPLSEGQLLLMPDVGAYAWGYMAPCEGTRVPEVLEVPESMGARRPAAHVR